MAEPNTNEADDPFWTYKDTGGAEWDDWGASSNIQSSTDVHLSNLRVCGMCAMLIA